MTEVTKQEIVDRMVMVAADRVDSLVSRYKFKKMDKPKAMACLKKCLVSVMDEMNYIHYNIIIKNKKLQILVNIKLFNEMEPDYDLQLRYSIADE